MLNIQLNYTQLFIAIAIIVASYVIVSNLLKIGLKILFTTKLLTNWHLKREREKAKITVRYRKLISRDNLLMLEKLIEEIDKTLINAHNRKQFWKDWALNKTSRQYWMKTLIERNIPKEERKSIHSKEIKKNEENNNKMPELQKGNTNDKTTN